VDIVATRRDHPPAALPVTLQQTVTAERVLVITIAVRISATRAAVEKQVHQVQPHRLRALLKRKVTEEHVIGTVNALQAPVEAPTVAASRGDRPAALTAIPMATALCVRLDTTSRASSATSVAVEKQVLLVVTDRLLAA
jgi:hypothetical protein